MQQKLIIGTAQIGQDYGITNNENILNEDQARPLVIHAREKGVQFIDTAIIYGKSQEILGNVGVKDFKIITKIPHILNDGLTNKEAEIILYDQIIKSIRSLNIDNLYAILLHEPIKQLKGIHGKLYHKILSELKNDGKVKKIGVSVYSPNDILILLDIFNFEIVQAPFSIIDQRFLNSGLLDKLNKLNISFHARSIFLQGLLLMNLNRIPDQFSPYNQIFQYWHKWLFENQLSALDACLNFVNQFQQVNKVIVGIDKKSQLTEILKVKNIPLKTLPIWPKIDENLINPTTWK